MIVLSLTSQWHKQLRVHFKIHLFKISHLKIFSSPNSHLNNKYCVIKLETDFTWRHFSPTSINVRSDRKICTGWIGNTLLSSILWVIPFKPAGSFVESVGEFRTVQNRQLDWICLWPFPPILIKLNFWNEISPPWRKSRGVGRLLNRVMWRISPCWKKCSKYHFGIESNILQE